LENTKSEDNPDEVKYEIELSKCATENKRSLVVDFNDLYDFNPEEANALLENPFMVLSQYNLAAFHKLRLRDSTYADKIKKITVRIRNIPNLIHLRKLGATHLEKLIMIKGVISQVTPIQPLIIKAAFKCESCGEIILLDQIDQFLTTPRECTSCGSRRGFVLFPKESQFINNQTITIQEDPGELPAGQLPRPLSVELTDDIVDTARPGDRVNIVGSIQLIRRQIRGGTAKVFDFSLVANNIDIFTLEDEILEITAEDEKQIRELAEDPWVYRKLLQSISPSLLGLSDVKEAILLLLFGGTDKKLPDQTIRGSINVLLCGDPGIGKSQLLAFTANIAPRGLLTHGRGSSAAGLTAAVVKPKDVWLLEAGAMVLADLGICCIDEMDKMRDEDREAIHPAMEQQKVIIHKAGISATLNARTSILAAANPVLGRYNPYQTIAQNLGSSFPIPLLSRFDLIFIMRDLPQREEDTAMARHLSKIHRQIEEVTKEPLPQLLLKKYIAFSRAKIHPRITKETLDCFEKFYVEMRSASIDGGEGRAISITPRQYEALVRLAEARAKAHLREETTIEDAESAIALMRRFLETVGIDLKTGEIDIDILYSGKPRSLQIQLQTVLSQIDEMQRIEGMVGDDQLYESLATEHQIGRTDAAKFIGVLMKDGTIYSPRPGYYRRTG